MRPNPITPERQLEIELEAGRVLLDQLRELAAGDADFFSDLVEGETGIFDLIEKIIEAEFEDETLLAGLEVSIKKLQERKSKTEARIETARALVASAFLQLGLKTRRFPLGTITVSPKTPTAVITDETEIPSRFWKPQDPKIDKAELNKAVLARKAAIDAAQQSPEEERAYLLELADAQFPEIPGATISNGGIKLAIRR